MKLVYCVATVGLLLAAGCIPDSFLNKDAADKAATQTNRQPGKPHNYVGPDQVDERNCHEKERALRQELDQDEAEPLKPATPAKR